ncbi:capsular polysaccharide export protein [Pacificibacter maritimus]|uniref:Capsular polysaccharide export protein n=1 Tax=Pacificibacter maritimus TaxID=762213 RepID=A0A3N4U201_9RHOB|nr:capsular biosynthesis protein [Pacificibacter maritimus]RPE64866.1 capsular polysaccharide export protein [Pacificibacter maritimus]
MTSQCSAVLPHIDNPEKPKVFVHRSRKDRINAIFDGFLPKATEQFATQDIGLRLFGPPCDPVALRLAAASGNKVKKSGLALSLKTRFLKGQFNWADHLIAQHDPDFVVVWNGIKGHRRVLAQAAMQRNVPIVYFEEAPLPGRVTVDFVGVNYGNSLPRRADFYTAWALEKQIDLSHWRRLGAAMQPRGAARADVAQQAADASLSSENFIFCPLQVPGDSQISIYGKWISSVEHMIDVLSEASKSLPDGWHLRIKEHPSARVSFGDKLTTLTTDKFRVDNVTNTFEQVAASKAVINVNSSVGLQSFFFDKPVLVLGHAFYAFDGTATEVSSVAELGQLLCAPEDLGYNAQTRDGLMSYLDHSYLPDEQAVKNGEYTLQDMIARDRDRDRILASLG